MPARLFIYAFCLPALALGNAGCDALRPDHVTGTYKHVAGRTSGRPVTADEGDVSATYDFPHGR